MIVKVQESGFVNLDDFKNLLDISLVVYYKITTKKNKTITLKFYDKDKKLVKPYNRKVYQLILFSDDLIFNPYLKRSEDLQELSQDLAECKAKYKISSYRLDEVIELESYVKPVEFPKKKKFISQAISQKKN